MNIWSYFFSTEINKTDIFLIISFQSISRQSSLVEDRIDDSDEDDFQEERAGMLRDQG